MFADIAENTILLHFSLILSTVLTLAQFLGLHFHTEIFHSISFLIGGIFDNESYRSSLKKWKKKGKGKKKEKKKEKKHKHRKEKKGKKHHSHHHRDQKHFHSQKKSKPTPARVKEFTAEPTFFGKTFGDLTNKQGELDMNFLGLLTDKLSKLKVLWRRGVIL